jgi:uncharacterized delta-60 repeat protein
MKFKLERKIKKYMIIFVLLILGILSIVGINYPPDLADALDRQVNKVGVQSSGKVILAGDFGEVYLIRLNSDNTIDTSFAKNVRVGLFNRSVRDFEVLSDDSIIVVGEFTSFDQTLTGYIAKLSKNGGLDTDFTSNTGAGFDDTVNNVTVLPTGKILAVGSFSTFNGDSVNKIALMNADGTLDSEFNPNGVGFDKAPVEVAVSPNGNDIYVSGHFISYNDEVYPYIIKMNDRGVASESFGLVE